MNNQDPYHEAGRTCGGIFLAICAGLIIGFSLVYWKFVLVALVVVILIIVLTKDYREFRKK